MRAARLSWRSSISPRRQVPHLIKPPKNPSQWKPLLARLQLLAEIFSKFGVAQGGGGKGLPVEAVMPLLLKSMENANGDVRQCAIKLVVDMHKQCGRRRRLCTWSHPRRRLSRHAATCCASEAAPAATLTRLLRLLLTPNAGLALR